MTTETATTTTETQPAATTDTAAATTTTTTETTPAADAPKGDEKPLLFQEPEKKEGEPDPADKKDGEDDADKKDGDDKDKAEEKPEPLKVTDFELQDGFEIAPEVATELEGIINNPELDEKGKVQQLMNLHMKMIKGQQENFIQFRDQLRSASKADPVIGGDKLEASIKAADNAVYQLAKNPKLGGSEDTYNGFVQRLTVLGLGDDPYVIRFLNNVNTLLDRTKDDTLDGGNSGGGDAKALENILWKDMK